MKKIITLLAALSTLAFTASDFKEAKNDSIIIDPSSQLLIKGKSNINTFTCQFDVVNINNPIQLHYNEVENKLVFEKTTLVLNNSCFDCGNRLMNKDFNDLLKTDVHPQIILQLKEIYKNSNQASKVNALISLNIAGVTKAYSITLDVSDSDTICVSGSLGLNINDFNLKAPKKALGLIVVSENIEIEFHLYFKKI